MALDINWMRLIAPVLVSINLFAFGLYGYDKRKAIRHERRIRNRTLLGFAVCGGSLGALLGMLVFRHKTRTWYYVVTVPAALLLHIFLIKEVFYG